MTWEDEANQGDWIKIVRPVNGWIQARSEDGKVFAKQIRHNVPNPWLIAQQRFGPPPAYPDLQMPGLNAPIPPGHEYGYGEGQWGKPPIGREGQPLYGNPFGHYVEPDTNGLQPKSHWGDLIDVSDEDSSDDSSSEEEEEGDEATEGMLSGTASATSGITSGVGTGTVSSASGSASASINLRKKGGIGTETPDGSTNKSLFTVVRQQEASTKGALFGSSHVYDLQKMDGQREETKLGANVNVAIDPQEIGTLDEQTLKRKFEDALMDNDDGSIPTKKTRRPGSRFDRSRTDDYSVKF